MSRLQGMGAQVVIHDPIVPGLSGDLFDRVAGCDALVLMVSHGEYKRVDWPRLRSAVRLPILVDGRNLMDDKAMTAFGWRYVPLGSTKQKDGHPASLD